MFFQHRVSCAGAYAHILWFPMEVPFHNQHFYHAQVTGCFQIFLNASLDIVCTLQYSKTGDYMHFIYIAATSAPLIIANWFWNPLDMHLDCFLLNFNVSTILDPLSINILTYVEVYPSNRAQTLPKFYKCMTQSISQICSPSLHSYH